MPFVRHAIDPTLPLIDSRFSFLNRAEKEARASQVGVLAAKASQAKRDKIGTTQEQQTRGNAFTMQTRCRLERINFWPIGIEGDGVPSKEFDDLINKVSKSAFELRGHDAISFAAKWRTEIGIVIAKTSAKVSLAGCLATKIVRRRSCPSNDICGPPQCDVPEYISTNRAFRNAYSDRILMGSR